MGDLCSSFHARSCLHESAVVLYLIKILLFWRGRGERICNVQVCYVVFLFPSTPQFRNIGYTFDGLLGGFQCCYGCYMNIYTPVCSVSMKATSMCQLHHLLEVFLWREISELCVLYSTVTPQIPKMTWVTLSGGHWEKLTPLVCRSLLCVSTLLSASLESL